MKSWEIIVIGLGGFGSAALYHLAKRGVRALGIDQFGIAHDRGSSHGETRLIRRAYFEHPDYVPLVDRAMVGWGELEDQSQEKLFSRTGLFLCGPPECPLIQGTRRAAKAHDLKIEETGPGQLARSFSMFRPPNGAVTLFEPDAGTLPVESCIQLYNSAARRFGAAVLLNEQVQTWSSDGHTVSVQIDSGTYHAGSLIIAAGPWAGRVLNDLRLPLTVLRKPAVWFAVRDPSMLGDRGCPVFWFDLEGHSLYGFPSTDGLSIKMGEHSFGELVDNPTSIDRSLRPDDLSRLVPFIESCLPHVEPRVLRHTTCMYTMTPDEHFIVDLHPGASNVAFVAGLSGHGFKFAPVLGSALADLVLTGSTSEPIGFLGVHRTALQGSGR